MDKMDLVILDQVLRLERVRTRCLTDIAYDAYHRQAEDAETGMM